MANHTQKPSQQHPEPKLMSLSRMVGILAPHLSRLSEHLFISSELAVIHADVRVFKLVMQQQPPFIINDYRLGIVIKGAIDADINLVEKHIEAGSLVFLGPGSIITPRCFSDELEIHGFALTPSALPFTAEQLPTAFNGQVRDFQLQACSGDLATSCHIIDTMWHVVSQSTYDRKLVGSLVAAQMHHYNRLFCQYADQLRHVQTREQTIFDRFIYLVNTFAVSHHRIAFYASKMCLTERYLSTVVRQASGITAKEWIDRALLARIKAELRHSGKPVAQIAEEMNFANPSFFCKYFKRLTGLTPGQFTGA